MTREEALAKIKGLQCTISDNETELWLEPEYLETLINTIYDEFAEAIENTPSEKPSKAE